jgi:cytochrome c-type biogenesis protein CcmE
MKFGAMKAHRRNRLLLVLSLVVASGTAVGLALLALSENINLFYSPQQIAGGDAPVGKTIRAGGMVAEGSVRRTGTDLTISFVISDLDAAEVTVEFDGILPDLFREGQGVIALGKLSESGVFVAEEVLAKHDETYMPPEVQDVLDEAHEGVDLAAASRAKDRFVALPGSSVPGSRAGGDD